MITHDCKGCGGTLEFQPGETAGVCDHCGKRVALPKTDDDRIARMCPAGHVGRSFIDNTTVKEV